MAGYRNLTAEHRGHIGGLLLDDVLSCVRHARLKSGIETLGSAGVYSHSGAAFYIRTLP